MIKKFTAALSEDYNNVAQVLTGTFTPEGGKTEGFMDNLTAMVSTALRTPDGLIQSRKKTLEATLSKSIEGLLKRLSILKKKKKFKR